MTRSCAPASSACAATARSAGARTARGSAESGQKDARRGLARGGIDDLQPVAGLAIRRIEAHGLAEEDAGRLVLVAARGQLAEQAIRDAALRIEPDDVAEVGLGIEIAAQRDVSPGTKDAQQDAIRLGVEGVVRERDHAREVPGLEQLLGGCDDSSIHEGSNSK